MPDRNKESLFSCPNLCWMIAVVLGFAAFMLLLSKMGQGAPISMLLGIAVFFVAGWLLGKVLCSETETTPETASVKPAETPRPVSTATTEPKEPAAVVTVSEAVVKTAPVARDRKPVAPKAEAEKGDPKKPAPEAAAPKAAPVVETAAPEIKDEKKPRTMKAPRKAGADDLKLLKGVGPKLEKTLNELGFFHYDQVAKWSDAEIEWVDARLRFKGRIERDGWIEQAKILADGGETEFSTRGKKA
ncbi:NADH:quinone oxidoreductase [Falsihalocynthiibacter sp. BN13B15]|uniref:NADH:quinone oxidoreductase n=1 Tax=Falsihalocynthiibacter sp. BN13B15 TaxID=3240871 RepID=UPI00350F389A